MYYYYDVILNFQDDKDLYEFYEWEESDDIDFIKKIPLFKVSTKDLNDLIKYKVKFSLDFSETIKDKTILKAKDKTLKYAFLVSDTKNALALELDSLGNVISRSRLLLGDEINIGEIMFTMTDTKLTYTKLTKYPKRGCLRQIDRMKKVIKKEIDTLYENKNISKLKYLYFEWFNKQNEDINIVYQEMNRSLKENFNDNIERIYELIKHTIIK